jgi:hypothetical protein
MDDSTITLQQAQQKVDQWIKTIGVRYFSELTNMAILTEEVGELARIMATLPAPEPATEINNLQPLRRETRPFAGRGAVVNASNQLVQLLDFSDGAEGPVDFSTNPITGDVYYVSISANQVRRIRYTGTPWIRAVQWHPEWGVKSDPISASLFRRFGAAARGVAAS